MIKIINKDLKVEIFTFEKSSYKVEFRDAYDRYIILEQMDTKNNVSVSYWVVKVVTR